MHLKLRHTAIGHNAPPHELDDVECGKNLDYSLTASSSSSDFDYGDNNVVQPQQQQQQQQTEHSNQDKKDDDYYISRRSADLLNDLSPFSRRVVRFVTPSHPSLPDRCTSECLTVAVVRIIPSLTVLLTLPFLIWDSYPEEYGLFNIYPFIRHVDMVWSSLLHTSLWPIVVGTLLTAALLPRGGLKLAKYLPPNTKSHSNSNNNNNGAWDKVNALVSNITQSNWKMSLVLSIIFCTVVIVNMTFQMGVPHAVWNPFMWGWYHVYLPRNIAPVLKGACLDLEKHSTARQPLCLSEKEWGELSSGQLSSYNPDDVLAVQRGLDYLQNQSGGLIINALARNVDDAIPALKQNMEGLVPFFKETQMNKLALVVFENDSDDGTRETFKAWSEQESSRKDPRYMVDLMSCGPKNPDCNLGIIDRYDANFYTNKKASGVGKLGEFRQILLEYILGKEEYKDYSHMVVLDVDLGTSMSPLGLLHTLGLENGTAQEHVVASSSSQVWPGTAGTIIPPYDLSAFRPKETKANQKVRAMHQAFCELMPAGDRWRNMCEACSPMQLFMIQSANDVTNNQEQPYEVVSAFNGLTMYPMNLIRSREDKAKYDAGDDNQRCEHVGFHLSLQKSMFVNPKWSMNLKPEKPGGPTGFRGIKTLVFAIMGRPNVMFYLIVGNLVFFMSLIYPMWMIGISVKNLFMLLSLSSDYSETNRRIYSKSSYDNATDNYDTRTAETTTSSCPPPSRRKDSYGGIDTREM